MPRTLRAMALIVATAVLTTGCSLLQPKVSDDGLAKVSSRGPGSLYMKPNHPVGSYDDILVAKVGINYTQGQKPLPPETEQALFSRMIFGLQGGVDTEFRLAQKPSPCTLELGLYLTNLSFYEADGQGSQTSFINSFGQATLVFEFRDSMTDEALVRYGQTSSLGSGVEGGARGPDIDRLNRALDRMLENVGRKLQDVVPVAMEARSDAGCQGKIGRAVLEARNRGK